MVKKRLDAYVGKLNNKQIAEGINAARRNASRLIGDAEMLLDNERYATAASLAILAIEELGKEPILRRLAIASSNEEVKEIWKDYRTHTKKNFLWIVPKLLMEGASQLDDFKPIFTTEAEYTYLLDVVKQKSFYSDCLGQAQWSEPYSVIDKDIAIMLVEIAKLFLKSRDMEEKEIELWVKHMGRVKGSNLRKQKEALLHWFAEMHTLGLRPEGEKVTDVMQWLGLKFDK